MSGIFRTFAAKLGKMKKLYIETYGCQMNVADSEVVASVMQMAGYETTESLNDADAVLLNTCSVRDNAEQKIYNRLEALNALRRQRGKLIIGVLGCMAERVKEELLECHHCDLVAGPDAYLSLPDLTTPVVVSAVATWRASCVRYATCAIVDSRR